MVEVLVTSIMDQFSQKAIELFRRKELLVLAVCSIALLLGIPCVMQVQTAVYWIHFNQIITTSEDPSSGTLANIHYVSLFRWESTFFS